MHIVFLELTIHPACSIAFEAEPKERSITARPPRDPKAPLFAKRDVLFSLPQGGLVLASVLTVFAFASYRDQSDDVARTLAFSTLVFGMLGSITVNRSRSANVFQSLRAPNRA